MKTKMTISQLEVENARLEELLELEEGYTTNLERENARLKYEIKMLSKDYYTDKIKDYLIHNGVKPDLARVLATDIYKMIKGDL